MSGPAQGGARSTIRPGMARAPPGALPGRLRLGYREPARYRRPALPPAGPAATKTHRTSRNPHAHLGSLLLIAPALVTIGLLFLYPLGYSLVWAFLDEKTGGWSLANFTKAFDFYSLDIWFTVVIVTLATLIIGVLSIAIGGYLTLGENRVAVAALRWLYRWPLFIPFVVAGQLMRTFLAKNGMMNNMLVGSGVLDPLSTTSFLDWRGIVITFVWKQTPFAALLVAGRWPRSTARPWRRPETSGRDACACFWRSWSRRSRPPSWSPSSSPTW